MSQEECGSRDHESDDRFCDQCGLPWQLCNFIYHLTASLECLHCPEAGFGFFVHWMRWTLRDLEDFER